MFFVLLFLPPEQIFSQSASQTQESPNFVSAEMSLHEFSGRLTPWLIEHPDLATRVVTRSQNVIAMSLHPHEPVSMMYRLTYPTLDIYSSTGESFYYGDSSDVNVKVIDALPRVIPEPDLDPRYKARPSLREILSMIPGIPRSDWTTPTQIDYTIFAVILNRTGANPPQSKDVSASHAKKKTTYVQNMNGSGPAIEVTEVPSAHPDLDLAAARRNVLANQAEDEAIQRLKTRLNGSRVRVIEIRLEQ